MFGAWRTDVAADFPIDPQTADKRDVAVDLRTNDTRLMYPSPERANEFQAKAG